MRHPGTFENTPCYGGLRVNLGDTRAFLVGFCSFKVLLDGNQSVDRTGRWDYRDQSVQASVVAVNETVNGTGAALNYVQH